MSNPVQRAVAEMDTKTRVRVVYDPIRITIDLGNGQQLSEVVPLPDPPQTLSDIAKAFSYGYRDMEIDALRIVASRYGIEVEEDYE